MTTGAALFAAEACTGGHAGTANAAKDAGVHSVLATEDSTHVVRSDDRAVLAQGHLTGGVDKIARVRRGDGVDRAR